MLLLYIKITLRNILRHKLTSGLNILGLALGLTCTLLIFLYVGEELSYDRHFTKAERIYRITDEGFGDKAKHWAATPPVLGEAFKEFMPQVEQVGRLHYTNVKVLQYNSAAGDIRSFEEKEGYYADASITEIFDLRFVKGNAQHALNKTNSIVLTEETANRYFGQEDPVGKILVEAYDKKPLRVTGVIRDLPHTTHLKFDYLISMATLYAGSNNGALSSKGWNGFYTHALLQNRSSVDKVEGRMVDFTAHFYASPDLTRDQILANGVFRLQPLTEIHLHSSLEKEMNPNGDITYVYIFCTAAALILLVACFNFINIATVQIFKRLKEIGIRKVLGALRLQLVNQFLVESLVVTLLAAVLVVILMFFALPFYNYLTGSDLLFESIFTPVYIACMLLMVLGV
ncbi:MAG: ABC transporter permease, partial [Bacteroidetes bacterium]|nr:ABC transporter permease [Bacteroidota bacterium]